MQRTWEDGSPHYEEGRILLKMQSFARCLDSSAPRKKDGARKAHR